MLRTAAALVALLAWAGLAIQFEARLHRTGSVAETLWVLLRFFTVLTNWAVALTFTALALGRRVSPSWLGGVTLAILLVGIVDATLLRGLPEPSGGARIADIILHMAVPVAVLAYWLLFATKGRLRFRDPLGWMLFPLAYFAYALARGAFEGRYAYPFIDVGKHGLAAVLLNALAIAGGFVLGGMALVGLDSLLGRQRGRN